MRSLRGVLFVRLDTVLRAGAPGGSLSSLLQTQPKASITLANLTAESLGTIR